MKSLSQYIAESAKISSKDEYISEAQGLSNEDLNDLRDTFKQLMASTDNRKFIKNLKHIRSYFNQLKDETDYGFEMHVTPAKNPSYRLYDFKDNKEYVCNPQGGDTDSLSINKNEFMKMVTTNKDEIKYVWLPQELAQILIDGING